MNPCIVLFGLGALAGAGLHAWGRPVARKAFKAGIVVSGRAKAATRYVAKEWRGIVAEASEGLD